MWQRFLLLVLLSACFVSPAWSETATTEEIYPKNLETSSSVARLKQNLRAEQGLDSNAVKTSMADLTANVHQTTPIASFGGMLKGLFLCLGVFFIGVSIYRRLRPQQQITTEQRLKVLSRVALTPKSQLILARLDGRDVLVAVGSEQVALLEPGQSQPIALRQQISRTIECGEDQLCRAEQLHTV